MADQTELPTKRMVFLGSTFDKAKRYARLRDVTPEDVDFRSLTELAKEPADLYDYAWVKKHAGHLQVGGLYLVKYNPEKAGTISNSIKFSKPWPNKEEAARLGATDRANVSEHEALKEAVKSAKVDPLKEALKPVRAAYRGTLATNRTQLIAWVVAYITGAVGED